MSISRPPTEIVKATTYFKGLKISISNTQIDDENSPDMLNLLSDDRQALDKRPGKINLFTSIASTPTKGLMTYHKSTGDIHLFAHGTKLYKITDLGAGTYTEIASGLSGNKVRGFNYSDLFYFLDGTTYRKYDGTTVSTVVGKIPTAAISTPPAGGGILFEPLNYIQAGVIQTFSGDNATTVYQFLLTGLDATTAIVKVNGATKTEGVDLTVNRTLGTVTFTVAPNNATPDNVSITLYKTFTGNQNEIFNCTIPYIWGGADGDRVWFTGNSNYTNRDYGSGLLDPTYFPVTSFDNLGGTDEPIRGYSELYGLLLIIKRKGIYVRDYEILNGEANFPTKRLNADIGAESTDSICILDDFPTFVTRKGVYQVISVDTTQQNNVRHISDDIDKNVNLISIQGLLEMGNLDDYVGIDFNAKYWLFNPNNGVVWVYDYRYLINGVGQWFKLDNLYAECLLEIGANLYMGDSRKGMINRLLTTDDNDQFSDIEDSTATAINAYWTSKINNFNLSTNLKLVSKIFFDLKPSKKSSAKLYVRSDLKSAWSLVKEVFISLFTYSLLGYSTFTYGGSEFPKQTRTKVKAKKIGYYQIKLENNRISESFGLLNVAHKILQQRETK